MKFGKMYKTFFCLVAFLSVDSFIFSHDVIVINDTFLEVPYRITLYNIRPLLATHINLVGGKEKAVNQGGFFSLKYTNEGTFDSEFLSHKDKMLTSLLKIDTTSGHSRVNKYDKERIQRDIFEWLNFAKKHKDFDMYQLGIVFKKAVKKNRRGKSYEQNLGSVPVALYHGNECGNRSNLFDMFSLTVDRYLFAFGIGETISHKSQVDNDEYEEDQFQISMLGAIEVEPFGYFSFGFFQYTFNSRGVCYHRAFKPWTSDCLKRLSNSMTQIFLRNVLYDWFDGLQTRAPAGVVEVDILSKFNRYKFSETCMKELNEAFGLCY